MLHDVHQLGVNIYDVSEEVKKRTREIADEQECLCTIGSSKYYILTVLASKRQKMDTDAALRVHCESVKTQNEIVLSHLTSR